nr:DUF2071 domain-containing protein [Leptospira alexanderi]
MLSSSLSQADMKLRRKKNQKEFHCHRTDHRAIAGEFHTVYYPTSKIYHSKRDTLENWLTERYSLYCKDSQERIYRGEVHHLPWPLQKAECNIRQNTILQSHKIPILHPEPLVRYSDSLKVALFPFVPCF